MDAFVHTAFAVVLLVASVIALVGAGLLLFLAFKEMWR